MFDRLNNYEQRFIAMIFTSFGEARGLKPVQANLTKVMKVLENRRVDANRRGLSKFNELDAALQPWQFSMYNENDVNWRKALDASPHSGAMQDSIKAFINFQEEDFWLLQQLLQPE